ncbi:MAG: hypothetical protein JOZ96_10470 [Acidobacteria bacterium]|nr:hypothetical protein [Acidobacteriota bacterium]
MKKLAGLLAFAVALVGAILLTQYYTHRYSPPTPPPPPPAPAAPAPPATGSSSVSIPPSSGTYTDARGKAPVGFKVLVASLDPAAGKGHLMLKLDQKVTGGMWVWAYFFSPDAPGRYCAGEPVDLTPMTKDDYGKDIVSVNLPVRDCPAPKSPSSTYYARVNVSTESAFAARLTEQRISYDVSQASPVMLEGKK